MAYFMPQYRNMVISGSNLAECIVCKELHWDFKGVYDIQSHADTGAIGPQGGVFAQLLMLEPAKTALPPYYRIRLQEPEIVGFIQKNHGVDLLSLMTFIITHELLHIHRFATGKADFYGDPYPEELLVDTLTRVFLAKHPVTGLKNVLTVLDKLQAAPLYNEHFMNDQGRFVRAYL